MKSKQQKIKEAIDVLQIGESISKHDLIVKLWGNNDYFIVRSFDVLFCKVRRGISPKKFNVKSNLITRIE